MLLLHFSTLCIFLCLSKLSVLAERLYPRTDEFTAGDLCAIIDQRSAIANDRLYFTGGHYAFYEGASGTQDKLYWINLNTSFAVNEAIHPAQLRSVPSEGTQSETGAFFVDPTNDVLYSYGGFDDATAVNYMMAYNASSESWSRKTISGGKFNSLNRLASLSASSLNTDEGLGFVLGGWESDVKGMVIFNSSDPDNLSWTNNTDVHTPLTMGGTMQYLRLGEKGILVAIGGYDTDYVNKNLTGWSWDLRSMANISVYDIDSATWYNVTAQGDIPDERSEFCSVVSASPDGSSFQITIYGGWNLFDGTPNEDVYVLTIPSFQWIKISDSGNTETSIGSSIGRKDHLCHLYNERSMVVLGGNINSGSTALNSNSSTACNSSYPAIRVLDVTDFSWQSEWNPSPDAYEVPSAISVVIGGSTSGGATMNEPTGGFNDSSLSTILSKTVSLYNGTSTTSSSSSSSSSSSTTSSTTSKSSSHTGAIVGGVIGGLAIIAIIALGFFFLRRRSRRSKQKATTNQQWTGELEGTQPVAKQGWSSELPAQANRNETKSPTGYQKVDQQAPLVELDGGWHGHEAGQGDTQGEGTARRR
ncbi:MAG: hypothetical protein M1834_006008 [Cirrosporium novae-zelandiae]|nr:MAG: hypothetical protein M1834_006008 [Cirrosporium novae-zelandiae]